MNLDHRISTISLKCGRCGEYATDIGRLKLMCIETRAAHEARMQYEISQ